jgi:HSP20 family molecular chaperone IbpA
MASRREPKQGKGKTMPPRDLQAWMWAEACEALSRAERMHREFFRLGAPATRPQWEPPIDLFETEAELWIVVALPGVDAPSVEITAEDGVLVIAGERRAPAVQRAAVIHRIEIPQGHFERRVGLPPGRFELAQRELADGCLTLALRKLA